MTFPAPLLKGDELFAVDTDTPYEAARDISKYLLMHYGTRDDQFDRATHPLALAHGYCGRLSGLLEATARRVGQPVARALDVGCSVGGVTHALSGWVGDEVVGVDVSHRSIEVAQTLTQHGGGTFCVMDVGPFHREVQFRVADPGDRANIRFEAADADDLSGVDGPFDAVLLSNVLDRVRRPAACLSQFAASDRLLRRGGLMAIACPWSWYAEYSDPREWLGSAATGDPSEHALKTLLAADFELLVETDEPGVLRQNPREYDYFEAHVTVWRKR